MEMVPKVLLLTSQVPGNAGVGEIYLRDLCRLYPPGRMCCLHLAPSRAKVLEALPCADLRSMPFLSLPAGGGLGALPAMPLIQPVARWAYRHYVDWVALPPLLARAAAFARQQHVATLWVPLHAPWILRIAAPLAEVLGIDLVTTVWDPPAYNLKHNCAVTDAGLNQQLLECFARTMRRAKRCAVMSDAMGQLYQQQFGTQGVVLVHSPPGSRPEPAAGASDGPEFVIAYAGSMYARAEWEALVTGLDRHGWRIGGKPVKIRMMTATLNGARTDPAHIELLGWRPTDEALAILSAASLAYLPYWMDPAFDEAVRLAFPTKLCTYVAAGVPVLYHGPPQGSPARFMQRYPVGVACASLDPEAVFAALQGFLTDQAAVRRAREACQAACAGDLGRAVYRRRFAEFIGVSEEDLVPEVSVRIGS